MMVDALSWLALLAPWLGMLVLPRVHADRRHRLAVAAATLPLLVLLLRFLGNLLGWDWLGPGQGGHWCWRPSALALPLLVMAALLPWCLILAASPRADGGPTWRACLRGQGLALALAWLPLGSLPWAILWAASSLASSPDDRPRLPSRHVLAAALGLLLLGLASLGASWLHGLLALLLLFSVTVRGRLMPFHLAYASDADRRPLPVLAMSLLLAPGPWLLLATVDLWREVTWVASLLQLLALATSLWSALLAHAEHQARRVIAWILLSVHSLVIFGLVHPAAAARLGGLVWWVAATTAGSGLLLVLMAIEARRGRMDLKRFHGGYDKMPVLAGSYLVLGLALIAFPGTLGMVGQELLVDGQAEHALTPAILLVVVAALNGIALLNSYFHLFCGRPTAPGSGLSCRPRERLAIVVLILVLLGGGLRPQPMLDRQEAGWRRLWHAQSEGPAATSQDGVEARQ